MSQNLPPSTRRLWRKLLDSARGRGWQMTNRASFVHHHHVHLVNTDGSCYLRAIRVDSNCIRIVPANELNVIVASTPTHAAEIAWLAHTWFLSGINVTCDAEGVVARPEPMYACSVAGIATSPSGDQRLTVTAAITNIDRLVLESMHTLWSGMRAGAPEHLRRNLRCMDFDAIGFADVEIYADSLDEIFGVDWERSYDGRTGLQLVYHVADHVDRESIEVENIRTYISEFGAGIVFECEGVEYVTDCVDWDALDPLRKLLEGVINIGRPQEAATPVVATQPNNTPGFAPQQHVAHPGEVP